MAITVTSLGSNGNTAGSTLTMTGITVPVGSLIVIVVMDANTGGSFGSASDGGSNTYTGVFANFPNNDPANGTVGYFYAWNTVALGGATLTYNKGGTGFPCAMSALYATGIQTSSNPLDSAASTVSGFGSGGSSTSPSVSSGTPALPGELVIGAVGWNGATTDTFTQDSTNGAYASPPDFNHGVNGAEIAGGFLINSGGVARSYAPTITNHPWAALILGFKPALSLAPPYRRIRNFVDKRTWR